MSYLYKLVKMMPVCVLDVNKSGTNRSLCTQKLVILHTYTCQ